MKQVRIMLVALLVLLAFASTSFAAVNNKYFRADKQYFDIETGQYVVSGNIVINVENGFIAGEKAQVKLSTLEFWGTGGWLLKQYDVTFKGESAYVVFGKDIAMIEGGADFQRVAEKRLAIITAFFACQTSADQNHPPPSPDRYRISAFNRVCFAVGSLPPILPDKSSAPSSLPVSGSVPPGGLSIVATAKSRRLPHRFLRQQPATPPPLRR